MCPQTLNKHYYLNRRKTIEEGKRKEITKGKRKEIRQEMKTTEMEKLMEAFRKKRVYCTAVKSAHLRHEYA